MHPTFFDFDFDFDPDLDVDWMMSLRSVRLKPPHHFYSSMECNTSLGKDV